MMDLLMLKKTLSMLADDSRLRILNLINHRELMVKDICELLGMNQPTISRHLAKLRLLGIIIDSRVGNAIYCNINKDIESYQLIKFILKEYKNIDVFESDLNRILSNK